MRTFVALLGMFMVLGGTHALPDQPDSPDELATVGDEPFVFPPSLTAEMTWSSTRSPVGWGSFDLTAHPETDEIRVDVLLGTPASHQQWTCGAMVLDVDGEREPVTAHWAGVPMNDGVFDAVTAQLTIDTVRRMALAQHVRVELCGEGVVVSPEQRISLRDFVERFDDLAIYEGPSAPSPPPELGPHHEWIGGSEWLLDDRESPYPA